MEQSSFGMDLKLKMWRVETLLNPLGTNGRTLTSFSLADSFLRRIF